MLSTYEDAAFKRVVNAERRVNQGLDGLEIAETLYLREFDKDFIRITNVSATSLDVILPEAGSVPLGYDVKIQLVMGPTLRVLPVDKSLPEGGTLGFRLVGNLTPEGEWLVYSIGEDPIVPEAYCLTFRANYSAWVEGPESWTISIPAIEHGFGTQPLFTVYEGIAPLGHSLHAPPPAPLMSVGSDARMDVLGNIEIVAEKYPDLRFAGRIVVRN
jgi:hypothetical protein